MVLENSTLRITDKIYNSSFKIGGTLLYEIKNLTIKNTLFQNLKDTKSVGGGAIRIEESDSFK